MLLTGGHIDELVIVPGHVRRVGRQVGTRPDGRRFAGAVPKDLRPSGRPGAGPNVFKSLFVVVCSGGLCWLCFVFVFVVVDVCF
jgi:hypothetical protein